MHLRGSFNTFLGQQNLLRVINSSESATNITISTIRNGTRSDAVPVWLAPHARFDMNMNTSVTLIPAGAQTYGIVEILGLNGPVFAEVLRARYHASGLVDFAYSTPPRETN